MIFYGNLMMRVVLFESEVSQFIAFVLLRATNFSKNLGEFYVSQGGIPHIRCVRLDSISLLGTCLVFQFCVGDNVFLG